MTVFSLCLSCAAPVARGEQVEAGGAGSPPAAVATEPIECRALGGGPPGVNRRLRVEPSGDATFFRSGFTDEVGSYAAKVGTAAFETLGSAIREASGAGREPPPPVDSVVRTCKQGAIEVAFVEESEPAALRAAREQVVDRLLASPEWTLHAEVQTGPAGLTGTKSRVTVRLENRGKRAVTIDHPAARWTDRTRMVTDLASYDRSIIDSTYRWQPIVQVGGTRGDGPIDLGPGQSAGLDIEVRLPQGAGRLRADVIYTGGVTPEGGDPVTAEIDTRFSGPEAR